MPNLNPLLGQHQGQEQAPELAFGLGQSQAPGMIPAEPGATADTPDTNQAFAALHSQMEETDAQFRQLVAYQQMLGKVQTGLDKLLKLRDTIQLEDVVEAVGELVSHGLDPAIMAGMLADAPEQGEALAAWVQTKAKAMAGRTSQLNEVMPKIQHKLGVEAMQVLALESALPSPEGGLA